MSAEPSKHPLDAEPLAKRIAAGLARIGIVLRSSAWRRAYPAGLTALQAQLVVRLASRGRRGMRLGDLAEELGVTAATASDAVGALARKRLVRKARDPEDARAVSVTLTARGRRVASGLADWPDAVAGAIESLSPREQEALLTALMRIIRSLQEQNLIPVMRACVTCRYFRANAYPGSEQPHHCAFVDAPFGHRLLRLECPDHEPAEASVAAGNWEEVFVSLTTPPDARPAPAASAAPNGSGAGKT